MKFAFIVVGIYALAVTVSLAQSDDTQRGAVLTEDFEDSLGVVTMGWDNRYVSEGRDNLSGEGLWSFTIEAEYEGFLVGSWLAYSDGADYEERNFFAEYGFETGPVEWYLGYTFLQFPQDDNVDDSEVAVGLEIPEILWGLTPGLDWYHSFDADGSFMEFHLGHDITITDDVHIEPVLSYGRNDGYISDGHNGSNHLAFGIMIHYHISDRIDFETHMAQNWAINSDPGEFGGDETLNDFFHIGGGFSVRF